MARGFNGSSEYLAIAAGVVTYPYTVALWAKAPALGIDGTLFYAGDTAVNNDYDRLNTASATDKLNAETSTAAYTNALTTTSVSANAWFHACAVFESATSRKVYLNGGGEGLQTANVAQPATRATFTIGRFDGSSKQGYFAGDLAEYGIWNVALAAAEIAVLALAFAPLFVRPAALILYSPLGGQFSPEIDLIGRRALTLGGSLVATAHPRILLPDGPYIVPEGALTAAGGSGQMFAVF